MSAPGDSERPGASADAASIRLAVVGARGRMGERICALATADPRFVLVSRIDREEPAREPEPSASEPGLDVIIDFSTPAGTERAIELALARRAALLVGTTGLDATIRDRIAALSARVAVLCAANTSIGVAVLGHLVSRATELLAGWEIDIVEQHHSRKRDAPSGTALALAEAVERGGAKLDRGRIHAVRAGEIVGEHTVQFAGPGEVLRLEHVAIDRALFAHGALRAAAWLARRGPGVYGVAEALGLPR
ncbi:MAG TPA: 4-hydroxy-tetrahydrodipicolinate reductase [Phycisphaerales bacterium]|nr:4-hydroxy-tetrahydrodipicolinate reductase [Phycisphaerales bacterium]HMP37556.1 4-hydroxy-tetrahydrodipicolinate reductase [Phycisphaerales bacterium]